MSITTQELNLFQQQINNKLSAYSASLEMSFHFSIERLNDLRNNPEIKVLELEIIFNNLIKFHINEIISLSDKDTFNIRCSNSHINIPCQIKKEYCIVDKKDKTILFTITIMRKKTFLSHDPIEFIV